MCSSHFGSDSPVWPNPHPDLCLHGVLLHVGLSLLEVLLAYLFYARECFCSPTVVVFPVLPLQIYRFRSKEGCISSSVVFSSKSSYVAFCAFWHWTQFGATSCFLLHVSDTHWDKQPLCGLQISQLPMFLILTWPRESTHVLLPITFLLTHWVRHLSWMFFQSLDL